MRAYLRAQRRGPLRRALRVCVLLNTLMTVRTVNLSHDAYAALTSAKKEGESFSDVVRRLTGTHRSLMEFAGA